MGFHGDRLPFGAKCGFWYFPLSASLFSLKVATLTRTEARSFLLCVDTANHDFLSFHPSPLQGCSSVAAYHGCHRAQAGHAFERSPVVLLTQRDRQPFTPTANLDEPTDLTCMRLDCGGSEAGTCCCDNRYTTQYKTYKTQVHKKTDDVMVNMSTFKKTNKQ